MTKSISPTLDAWIAALEAGIEAGLEACGEYGVDALRIEEQDSDSTGRLRDSFTYATKERAATPGIQAPMSDGVPMPKTKHTVVIGTKCPYAVGVNYGREPSDVTMGYDELYPLILAWIEAKPVHPFNNFTPQKLAAVITNNIINEGSMAHEFWEPALVNIRKEAIKHIRSAITARLGKVRGSPVIINMKL